MMKASEFIAKLQNIVDNYKTLYVMGCFGAPMTDANKKRYTKNHKYNMGTTRTRMIKDASSDTFGFDCVCLIKGVLWGWCGNKNKTYGGAGYAINGVPDIGADTMITKCSGVTTDFSNIIPGEAVWLQGHIGVYIGGGKVIECTPAFKNCVQVTYCSNIKTVPGQNNRKWTKHGKLPYITYDVSGSTVSKPVTTAPTTTNTSGANNEEKIWNFLKSKGYNPYGIAGLMGNLYAESGLIPTNLQNTYEKKLGYSDIAYTQAVDSGKYTNFVKDAAGYGLAQWTYWSRKQNLLNYAKSVNKSIGDLDMQLGFLVKELSQYKGMDSTLKTAKSVKEASDFVLVNYERPANMSDKTKNLRASYGQKYFDKYAGSQPVVNKPVAPKPVEGGNKNPGFTPRLTRPEAGNKYYITKSAGGWSDAVKGKPTDSACNVLHNCVGYAFGRFNEIAGECSCKYLRPVNAENFIQYAGGLKVGTEPRLGACAVWQRGTTLKGEDGAGHVAIVEKVISPTEIITSESGWNAKNAFWTQTRKKGNGNWGQNSNYRFLGFIYNPAPCCTGTAAITQPVMSTNKTVKWTGVVTATSLNVRTGAGTGNANLSTYPTLSKNVKVGVCDTVKASNGADWHYVQITGSKGTAYGYVSSAYIKRVETAPAFDPTVTPDSKIDKAVIWTGRVTAGTLNVRTWAGTENPTLGACPSLKSGTQVGVCDSVKARDGSLWYYVLIRNKWYGFVSSKYIKRV